MITRHSLSTAVAFLAKPAAIVAILSLAAGAALRVYGANPSADGEPNAGTPLAAENSPCYHITGHLDPFTPTLAIQGSIYDAIFVATFDGYGKPFWNTPKGVSPATEQEALDAFFYTPLELSDVSTLRGDAQRATQAVILGGDDGCTSVSYEEAPAFEKGSRYLFFAIGPLTSIDGVALPNWTVGTGWSMLDQATVATPHDGELELSAVNEQLAMYPVLEPGEPLPAVPDELSPVFDEPAGVP